MGNDVRTFKTTKYSYLLYQNQTKTKKKKNFLKQMMKRKKRRKERKNLIVKRRRRVKRLKISLQRIPMKIQSLKTLTQKRVKQATVIAVVKPYLLLWQFLL